VVPTRVVLSINSGSSSLKFALHQFAEEKTSRIAEGAIDRIDDTAGRLRLRHQGGAVEREAGYASQASAIEAILAEFPRLGLTTPNAVGHRIVHGGPRFSAPERITPEVLAALRALTPYAPLHIPGAIKAIEAVAANFPDIPQVACFDTAFHWQMPEIARRFALPQSLWHDGIRRYGFHGISYEYIAERIGDQANGRVIVAHLGNGASMVAIRDGKSIDTTMGFTPTGGFMMGTRCGDLDPGVILHLLSQRGYDARSLDELVNHKSGLLGVSGVSADMKTLEAKRDTNPNCVVAIEMFCYQVRKEIGALSAALGGLDLLVFTGGIGEHSTLVRFEVCRALGHLGIEIEQALNDSHADTISATNSPCVVRVIPTDEDLMIARHTNRLVFKA
jgi:acetate kinase